jgi:Ion channel
MGRAPRRDHEAVPHLSDAPPGRRTRTFSTEDAYGLLLGIIVLTFVLLSQVDPARWTRLVVAPAVGAMLLLALYASRARLRLMRAAIIALAVAYVFIVVEALFDSEAFAGSIYLIYGLLILITPIVIINRILRHPEVQVSTILGAICAYMLLGMVFGFAYALIARIDPPFFADRGPVDQFDYFYFSYECLTTLGFGDFTSRGDLGRALSVLEAAVGQLFLVTLIARLVSQFKSPQRDTGSTGAE